MARFRYSYGISGDSPAELSDQISRLATLGYNAVELPAELSPTAAEEVRDLVEDAGLSISSICPSFTAERDLAHPDPEVRENALVYLREVTDLANAAGAPAIIVAPTAFLRTQPISSETEEWSLAVESIRAAGEYAASVGVDLTLECWNRYGTFLINRLEQAARMWRDTGLTSGGVLADTYHMNIEERSLPEAIRGAGPLINHFHLSDSNRAAPGLGHVDYAEVLRALLDIGYTGYLAFELDPRAAVRSGVMPAEKLGNPVAYLMEQGIEHLRRLESQLEET
jgi:sugar phosphate isomerase/epimerase